MSKGTTVDGSRRGQDSPRLGDRIRGVAAALLLSAALTAPGAIAAQESHGGPFLYVANQPAATVSVIDMSVNEVVETVDLQTLGFGPNAKPHHIAVEPDGAHWYLSLIGENRVLKFDRDNELVGQAEFEVPGLLALDAADGVLYVGRSMSAVNPPQRIGAIDIATMDVDEIDVFYPRPHALALHPTGQFVYSASLGVNQIAAVDVASGLANLVSLDGPPHAVVQFAVSPNGRNMVGTTQLTGQVMVFELAAMNRPELVRTVEVGGQPWHPVYTHDGRYVVVGSKMANKVSVIDPATGRVVKVIEGEGIAQPHGAAVSPDGRWIYVSNNNSKGDYTPQGAADAGTVVVIDAGSLEIAKVIEVGAGAA
ncbi:MAG: YncE family protein, partial [Gemmatimonadetes bacterium]